MVQRAIPAKIKSDIRRFIDVLREKKIPISKVILYGSFAKGTANRDSDIDVCFVSEKFTNPWEALQYLWQIRPDNENPHEPWIEPVGFAPEDFEEGNESALTHEIKKTGIEMTF